MRPFVVGDMVVIKEPSKWIMERVPQLVKPSKVIRVRYNTYDKKLQVITLASPRAVEWAAEDFKLVIQKQRNLPAWW
jgi:hypothetical protein